MNAGTIMVGGLVLAFLAFLFVFAMSLGARVGRVHEQRRWVSCALPTARNFDPGGFNCSVSANGEWYIVLPAGVFYAEFHNPPVRLRRGDRHWIGAAQSGNVHVPR